MSDPLGAVGLGQPEPQDWVSKEHDYAEYIERYRTWWPFPDGATGPEADEARKKREQNANQVATDYYDLVSPSSKQGWGQNFHYAPMSTGSSIKKSLNKYELLVGELTGLRDGMSVLDVGCGLGGPARTMAKNFGCKVVGITNSPWHVERGTQLTKEANMEEMVELMTGDFNVGLLNSSRVTLADETQRMPFDDNTFDAAYAFEAICYAPDLNVVYKELRRVLKPRASFGLHEWAMTQEFDPTIDDHRITRDKIERGNGLTRMPLISEIRDGLKRSSFTLTHNENMELRSKPGPWYYPVLGMLRFATCKEDLFTTLMMERRIIVPLATMYYWLLVKFKVAPEELLPSFEVMKTCTSSVARESQKGDIFADVGFHFEEWKEDCRDCIERSPSMFHCRARSR